MQGTDHHVSPPDQAHHFMNAAELESDKGQERLSACLFRVPVADEMVPMCRVNAGGVRDAVYARLTDPSSGTVDKK